jgi:thymidylate synthase
MEQYQDLVRAVLSGGTHKPNRTGVDTVAAFSRHYEVDLAEGFPLLTTKDLSGARWNSLVQEFAWYLSGEEHIRELREETGIWDAWADEEGHLDTAYGRFWRRFPVPDDDAHLPGESWPDDDHRWVTDEGTFDQLRYAVDQLRENPRSRRIVVNAWHPANAAVSTLPPCHYSYVFNVQDGRLHTHLTQRSGDVALGVPFNLASYALLTHVVAGEAGLEPGRFGHTVVDAHVYCGKGARGDWYGEHLAELQDRLAAVDAREGYERVRDWLVDAAPPEPEDEAGHDHVPGLLAQCSRTPGERPAVDVSDAGGIDDFDPDAVDLRGYDPAPAIRFAVAE